MNKNWNNATNIVDAIVKILYIFGKCPDLLIEIHDLFECCVACHRNLHQFCVNEVSDIKIAGTGPIYSNKTCREGFPDIALDMNAE